MGDLISRAGLVKAFYENTTVGTYAECMDGSECVFTSKEVMEVIDNVPSAQPGQRNARVFQGIIVEYPLISTYPEYEGKPYFSIKYTENGQEFIGYGTYKPEVLSEFLKEYFMLPAQQWIPVTEALPLNYDDVLVTDGENCEVAYWSEDAKAWDSAVHGCVSKYMEEVVAWQPLPTPWEGDSDG